MLQPNRLHCEKWGVLDSEVARSFEQPPMAWHGLHQAPGSSLKALVSLLYVTLMQK